MIGSICSTGFAVGQSPIWVGADDAAVPTATTADDGADERGRRRRYGDRRHCLRASHAFQHTSTREYTAPLCFVAEFMRSRAGVALAIGS